MNRRRPTAPLGPHRPDRGLPPLPPRRPSRPIDAAPLGPVESNTDPGPVPPPRRPPPVTGLILAAGASSRMGRPKALLRVCGQTYVERLCGLLRDAGCAEIVVVVGAHAAAIAPAVPGFARIVLNPEWRRGMRSSLRAGLRASAPGPVILTHVDRPWVAPETLAALMASIGPVVPEHAGRAGHPVRLSAGMRPRLLAADDRPLSALLDEAGARRLPVRDPGVCVNVNTPADHRWLAATLGRGP